MINNSKVKCKKTVGFTLLEILVVIAIIALLIAIALPNYISARARARDSKRIQELQQVKTALRLYFNDYGTYPAQAASGVMTLSGMRACGPAGTTSCTNNFAACSADFSAGGADGCQTIYMKKFPSYTGQTIFYYQISSGTDFRVLVQLENPSDPALTTSSAVCPTSGSATCTAVSKNYCVCAD